MLSSDAKAYTAFNHISSERMRAYRGKGGEGRSDNMQSCGTHPLTVLLEAFVGLLLVKAAEVLLSEAQHGVHMCLVLDCQLQGSVKEAQLLSLSCTTQKRVICPEH